METLPQDRYLDLLASSCHLLTAPGLNAPFEGFALGVPTSFLPPQNLTQVCQLPVYQEHGLAPRGLNLTELYHVAGLRVFLAKHADTMGPERVAAFRERARKLS